MPRHQYKKRTQKVDAVYDTFEVAKLINYIMIDGKKSVARDIVYTMLIKLKKNENDALLTLNKAISNVMPDREVRPRRLGGASYLIPTEIQKSRRLYLALNWIINAAQGKSNKEFHSFSDKLTAEVIEASKNQGNAVAKKQQTEKLAEQNKAFAHLKW